MERTNRQLERRLKIMTEQFEFYRKFSIITLIVIVSVIVASVTVFVINQVKINNLKFNVAELETANATLNNDMLELSTQYNQIAGILTQTSKVAVELDNEVKKMTSDNVKLLDELEKYTMRDELLNKYEYALYREGDNARTDIDFEHIARLQEICKDKGMNDETVDLILAIAMRESKGIAEAKNPESTATGLGQFLNSTGKFVYVTLMNGDKDNYATAVRDPETNLVMMAEYIDYLSTTEGNKVSNIMMAYSGGDSEYCNDLNHYLNDNNLDATTMYVRN